MQHKTRNPAAQGAAGLRGIPMVFSNTMDTLDSPNFQAEFIARRYHLTPVRARLICDLAGIGGRAR